MFRVLFFLPSVLPGVMMCTVYKELFSTEAMSSLFQKLFHLDYAPEIFRDESFANFAVLLNMVWMTFPGNLLIWGSTFSRVPDSVVEAAKLDGVNWLQGSVPRHHPIVWPTFALLFIMMFACIFNASATCFCSRRGKRVRKRCPHGCTCRYTRRRLIPEAICLTLWQRSALSLR